ALRGRHRRLPRPTDAGGEAGGPLVSASAGRPPTDDVGAHLVHDGPAQDRPRLGSALPHGTTQLRGLDTSAPAARGRRRRRGNRVRGRGTATPDPGAAGPPARSSAPPQPCPAGPPPPDPPPW